MPDVTIRNLPDVFYQELRGAASAAGRSFDEHVIHLLRTAVRNRRDPRQILARAAVLRASMPGVWVTQADVDRLKNEGRA